MTNLYRQKFTQEEQRKQLCKVLDRLIDQIGQLNRLDTPAASADRRNAIASV